MREKKLGTKFTKYSIRKISIGAISCAIKNDFFLGGARQLHNKNKAERKAKTKEDIDESDDDDISDTTKNLIKGAVALGALAGGTMLTANTAFADTTTPAQTSNAGSNNDILAGKNSVNLTSANQNSKSDNSASINSQKASTSTSASTSSSTSASTSAKSSESLAKKDSKTSTNKSISTTKTSTASDASNNSLSSAKTSTSNSVSDSAAEKQLEDQLKQELTKLGIDPSATFADIENGKVALTAEQNQKLQQWIEDRMVTFAMQPKVLTALQNQQAALSNVSMNISTKDSYTGKPIYVTDQAGNQQIEVHPISQSGGNINDPMNFTNINLSGSAHINDGAKAGDTITLKLGNDWNPNGTTAADALKLTPIKASDGTVIATPVYDASTN